LLSNVRNPTFRQSLRSRCWSLTPTWRRSSPSTRRWSSRRWGKKL